MDATPGRTDAAKPLEDVTSEQFNGDKQKLIGGGHAEPTPDREGSEVSPLQMEDKEQQQGCSCLKKAEGLKVIVVSTIVFSIAVTVALVITILYAPPQVPPHGSVATDHKECSVLGRSVLQQGGSAVDAAVASGLCMSVVHPHVCGIGGGGFMLVRHHKDKSTIGVDFRETAPSKATENMYQGAENQMQEGGLAISVPGTLKGLFAAHQAYGKLSWKDVVKPAARLALGGFKVSKSLADSIKNLTSDDLSKYKNLGMLVKRNDSSNHLLAEGDTMYLPKLGELLNLVADNGIDAFYRGIAKQLADEVQSAGGILAQFDMLNYTANTVDPLSASYKTLQVETMPAPSGGPLLVLIMNILDGYNFTSSNVTSGLVYHRIIEAMKFGYAHQGYLGDPNQAFGTIVRDAEMMMTNKTYATSLRNKISDDKTNDPSFYESASLPSMQQVSDIERDFLPGTCQVSIFGPHEDMVSLTISLGSPWGSKVVTSNQIVLNNHMLDFSTPGQTPANKNNMIAAGKRPFSYMSPTISHTVGRPCATRMALGASGGKDIVNGIVTTLVNLISLELSLKKSVENPRLSHTLIPDKVRYEDGFDEDILSALEQKGHETDSSNPPKSAVNVALKMNETISGQSDTRRDGAASIY